MTKRVGRNEPCPCGSGKKYKKCCIGKAFDYVEDDDGHVFRSIPMSNELVDLFKEQEQRFIEKFGRKPGPKDKVFFDAPHVEHMVNCFTRSGTKRPQSEATFSPASNANVPCAKPRFLSLRRCRASINFLRRSA